jgi:hypothetical protein
MEEQTRRRRNEEKVVKETRTALARRSVKRKRTSRANRRSEEVNEP